MLLIHSSIQQIFNEQLLYARHFLDTRDGWINRKIVIEKSAF